MAQAKCAQAPLESPPIDIDPRGDLLLKVGLTKCIESNSESTATDKNIPATDAAAGSNSTDERMLYGEFAESKPVGSDWVVELPDDDAEAIEFLLYISHARLGDMIALDHTPELNQLYQFATAADKWDMIRHLRPWAKTWAHAITERIQQDLDQRTLIRYLWICWILGAKMEFIRTAQRFAMQYPGEDEDVEYLFSDTLEPPGIIPPFQDTFDEMLRRKPDHPLRCKVKDATCDDVVLAKLSRSLHLNNLWPIPQNTDVRGSVTSLLTRLHSVDSDARYRRHHSCPRVLKERKNSDQTIHGHLSAGMTRVLETNGRSTGTMELVPCPLALRVQEPAVVNIDPDGDLLLRVGRLRCVVSDDPEAEESEDDSDDESDEESEPDHGDEFTDDPAELAAEDTIEETVEEAEGEAEEEPGEEVDGDHREQEAEVAKEPEIACPKHDRTTPVTFRVCSRTLARSSPLPADNITAVEFFFNTIHARFDNLPSFLDDPDPDWLYEVAVIADKYVNVRLVRPWAAKWADNIMRDIRAGDEDISTLEQFLWVLWVLGAQSEFKKAIRYYIMAWEEEDLVHDVLEAPGTTKIIETMRVALLSEVLFPFQDALNKLSLGGQNHRYSCKAGTSGCEEVMLGKLIRSLNKQKLWPLPQPQKDNILISVNSLVDRLNQVDRDTIRSIHRESAAPSSCKKVLDQSIHHSTLRGNMKVMLTDYQKTQIEEHGRATGLSTTSEEPAKKRVKLSH
ncbi:hypothetical protein PG984_013468 [Apiospora sp. TS-2023a]